MVGWLMAVVGWTQALHALFFALVVRTLKKGQ